MKAGEPILVFPGGAKEVFRDERHEKYSLLWKQRKGFARLAIQHSYTIVPVASIGMEDMVKVGASFSSSWFWKMIGDKERALKNAFDAPESTRFPILVPSGTHSDLYVSFGDPITPPALESCSEAQVWSFRELVKERLENLIQETLEWRDVHTLGYQSNVSFINCRKFNNVRSVPLTPSSRTANAATESPEQSPLPASSASSLPRALLPASSTSSLPRAPLPASSASCLPKTPLPASSVPLKQNASSVASFNILENSPLAHSPDKSSLSVSQATVHEDADMSNDTASTSFSSEELDFIRSVRKEFAERNHHHISDDDIVKFLVGHKHKQSTALEMIDKNLSWKLEYGLDTICHEDFSTLASSAKLYFSGGYDREGHPVVIFRSNRHYYDDYDHNVRFVVHFVERMKRAGLGRVTLLVDRFDMTADNTDDLFIKHLAQVFQPHYPEHLAKLIVIPPSWLISIVWPVIRLFLDPATVDKVNFLGKDYRERLRDLIPEEHLLQRYGGLLADWTEHESWDGEIVLHPRLTPCANNVVGTGLVDRKVLAATTPSKAAAASQDEHLKHSLQDDNAVDSAIATESQIHMTAGSTGVSATPRAHEQGKILVEKAGVGSLPEVVIQEASAGKMNNGNWFSRVWRKLQRSSKKRKYK
ncbi:MAG: hypothetical protein SGCHY_002315 [Lobulomycetales sp.]